MFFTGEAQLARSAHLGVTVLCLPLDSRLSWRGQHIALETRGLHECALELLVVPRSLGKSHGKWPRRFRSRQRTSLYCRGCGAPDTQPVPGASVADRAGTVVCLVTALSCPTSLPTENLPALRQIPVKERQCPGGIRHVVSGKHLYSDCFSHLVFKNILNILESTGCHGYSCCAEGGFKPL